MAARLSEFQLIEKYFAPLSGKGAYGLQDDAAMLELPKNKTLVVTTDAIAEGIHFLSGTDPKLIAQKAIRTNLSDLAAKGATPFAISLALGLHKGWDNQWIKSFAKGIESDCKQFSLSLCGGDTFKSPGGVTISITAFGHVEKKDYASRLGAKSGDGLFVTGTIGDAALGLHIAIENIKKPTTAEKFLLNRYELPKPRVEAAKLISKFASAAMDISDGFVGDLEKLCAASKLGITLDAARIPFSKQALNYNNSKTLSEKQFKHLVTGGDDYELLMAVPKSKRSAFEKEAAKLLFPVTYLGQFKKGTISPTISDENGKPLKFKHGSYEHF